MSRTTHQQHTPPPAEVRAPGRRQPQSPPAAAVSNEQASIKKQQVDSRTTLSHLSAHDSEDSGLVAAKPTIMNKSRPSSRRQSNVGGKKSFPSSRALSSQGLMLIDPVDKQRMSLDGIREEGGAERHVKFNIDFDEWRRYLPYFPPTKKKICYPPMGRALFSFTQNHIQNTKRCQINKQTHSHT